MRERKRISGMDMEYIRILQAKGLFPMIEVISNQILWKQGLSMVAAQKAKLLQAILT